MKTKHAFIKYLISLLVFGSNGIVASHIAMTSYEIVFMRALIGSLLLAMIFILTKQKTQIFENKGHFLYLITSGIALGTSWMFLYEAYQQIGVSVASLAYYCGPVIVIILSPFIFREKLTRAKLIGFFAVLIGMFFVNIEALSEGKTTWGLICGMMSAVLYAVMVIFNKKANRIKGLENPMWQLIASFLTVAVFLVIRQGFVIRIEAESLVSIFVLGLINTGFGCYLYFSAIGALPVQTVSICGYLEPLSALILSTLLLGEKMAHLQIIGAVLILGGAAFGELHNRRKTKAKNSRKPMKLEQHLNI